ncbi:MAG: monovalent cation/H+ antiporter complex subunit F [Candidatus Caldarchaeum sp.]|nr:monovalent cation/H+ antiporter complex subunit F [Candidatus Caldarchaeum sp.]MCS7133821.1 monovalent cation/H+ antiporter complex subunit F [Candidatus Caldarchaeum sp.]MCX8200968.1 monovalent cation/H+ antiporter complex subunit F [Candidatus Caldarchaeum sp.]MDW8063641.1 monovalent cation/H+ antiporter complex subunit F [Candidatus Caldarchaeum sp.]MDW8435255.1 monovalent cation/H+ antiporter complex subunit F [Candidatus Caldarchaeum sp.]
MIFLVAMVFLTALIPFVVYSFLKARILVDKVVSLETLVFIVTAVLILNAFHSGSSVYIDAALVLSVFGFLSTVAIAKYLEEGNVFA